MKRTSSHPKAQFLAGVLSGASSISTLGPRKSVMYRGAQSTLTIIDSMAEQANVSRNSMMTTLLNIGIDEVIKNLDQKALSEFDQIIKIKTHEQGELNF